MKTRFLGKGMFGIAASSILLFPFICAAAHTHETEIVIVNLTDTELKRSRTDDDSHTSWDDMPPAVIAKGQTIKCKHHTSALFYGCDGGVTYALATGGTVSVRVRNTFASGNHFYYSISGVKPIPNPKGPGIANLHVNVYGPAHGNFITVTFFIGWADLDQQVNNIDWRQVNQNLNKALQELTK